MKRRGLTYILSSLFLFVFSCFGQSPAGKQEKVATPLVLGQSVEGEMTALFDKHVYRLDLAAGQYVRVEADQKGCDIIFALMSPDRLNTFDVDNAGSDGVESATAAVERGGIYELQVVAMADKKGTYKLRIAELRPATEKELARTAGIVIANDVFLKSTSSSTNSSIMQSISRTEAAIEHFRRADEKSHESRELNTLGSLYMKLGYTAKAVENYEKAIQLSTAIDNKYEISLNLSNLGTAFQEMGDSQRALEALLNSLQIRREIGHKRGEAIGLNKLGSFFTQLGDANRALHYFQQALTIIQGTELSKNYEVDAYENLGTAYLALSDLVKARDAFQKAVDLSKQTKSKRREASSLNSLGNVHNALAEHPKAIEFATESLRIYRALEDKSGEAAALNTLGQIHLAAGEIGRSLEHLERSLVISRSIENSRPIAQTLLALAKAQTKNANLDAAQKNVEEAIAIVENMRSRVQTVGLRDSFSTNLQKYYGFYVELLMQRHDREPEKGYAALALKANERGRARGLINLLAESNANFREDVNAELLQKEVALKARLSARLENLTKVLSGKSKVGETESLRSEIEQIRVEHEQTQSQIRLASPRYAALTQPKTLDLTQIQTEVLDEDSVLLEYALGETRSFLWIATKNEIRVAVLPAAGLLEERARKLYESLTARNKRIKFETPAEFETRIARADSDFEKLSAELSRLILEPAGPFLSKKRLLVVADGALQYVPFAALSLGTTSDKAPGSKPRFLVETNEIVNLPSASALAVLRKETRGRRSAPKTLAVLADPIFDKDDERFQAIANTSKPDRQPASKIDFVAVSKRQTRDIGDLREGLDLVRLPFTRREADLISSVVPEGQKEKLLDFAASRRSATSSLLSNYRFVHFATHGFINDQNPELSGVVFSTIDENGKEQDGFLRVGDIYNLKLPSEMVVLSGCRTGIGKDIRGEGLVGMTRAFMYAGAKRVTVSLWDIHDEATSALMSHYYREMFGNKKLTPAAALRQAQKAMIRDRKWANPYFWSTFVLQGEPN